MGDVSQLPGSRPSARNPAASDLRKHCKDASCHSLMAVLLYQSTRKILCWMLKPAQTTPAEFVIRLYSAQPGVLCPGLFEDGDVRVGMLPEGEEVLVGAPGPVLFSQ